MAGVDINTLTMKHYFEFLRENQAPGVVKPEIEGNVNFEIKSQFMRELREETFSGNKNEDANDHVDRVLNIVCLFNIPGVSQDAVLLRVFLFTLTGTTKRYCPPSKTATRLEDIHNFKQEIDELLYQAWERFNDLSYKCPTHDINNHQKVNTFYKGLSTTNQQLLDSQGPISGMTPTQALTAIQTMADHSQKWHDKTLSRSLSSNSTTDGLAAIVSKLDNLGRNMKKLKENFHAIQVGCQICEGRHLDKECPHNEEVKQVEEAKYGEFGLPSPFNGSNRAKYHIGLPGYYTHIDNRPVDGEKKPSLEELMNKHLEESAQRSTEMNEWIKKLQESAEVINCFKEALDPDKDLRGRSFDDYRWVFDLEIEQLADEYKLGIRKKDHMLEMIWENCKNIQGSSSYEAILETLLKRNYVVKCKYVIRNTRKGRKNKENADSYEGRKVKHLVIRNNMTQIWAKGESFKDDQYILVTQVKQVFYLEDMARRPPNWKVVEHANLKKFSNEGVIVVEDNPDVIHFDNSSDLALSSSLNDLDLATLHIDGKSTDVDAPPNIIDIDEDDDIIDDENAIPHDLADSDDEDLVNVDDDMLHGATAVTMAVMIVPLHTRYPPVAGVAYVTEYHLLNFAAKGTRKPNLGGRKAGRLHTRQETRNLGLKKITDVHGPIPIQFEWNDRETLMPLGDHAGHWANYLEELVRELPMHYSFWRQVPAKRKVGVLAKIKNKFDLKPHMESERWPKLYTSIQQHLQKIYNGNKSALKAQHWVPNLEIGTYDVESIRQGRPANIFATD
nr:hypothetical protein [Tanacetum cinerariifolium]